MLFTTLASASAALLIMRARRQHQTHPPPKPPSPLHRSPPSTAVWAKPVNLAFVHKLPKIELHAHIGGSIRDATLLELINSSTNTAQNYPDLQVLQSDQRSLSDCFQLFDAIHDLVSSLAILKRITKETIQDFAMENCIYLELRTTPRHDLPNVTPQQYVDTVVQAIQECQQEECTQNIVVRLLLSISRAHDSKRALETVHLAGTSPRHIVVGLDFSGNPTKGNIHDFLPAFDLARELYQLPITFHIGEIDDAAEVSTILSNVQARDRLGHALYLTASQRNGLLEKNVVVEICPTSNVRTLGLASLADHPTLPTWLTAEEYPLVVCTDDRGVFRTTLSKEYVKVAHAFDLGRADVVRLVRMAVHHVFDTTIKSQIETKSTDMLKRVLAEEEEEEGETTAVVRNESTSTSMAAVATRKGVTVVGITGVSCAGKSTISKLLMQRCVTNNGFVAGLYSTGTTGTTVAIPRIHVLHLDTYRAYTLFGYRHTDDSGKREWEHPSNGAWNAIQVELQKSIATLPSGSIVLVDGHMILEDERIRNALDLCVYMNITEEECRNRRMKRRMPAPHGWNKNKYFDTHIWNVHVERHQAAMNYFTGMQQKNCLLTLDGTQKIDVLVDQIFDLVKAKRKKVSSKL